MESMQKRILMTVIVGLALIIAFYIITNAITKYTGFLVVGESKESDFNMCLNEQDITLYVNTEDLAKTLRDINLIDYLQYFKIVNCATNNKNCIEEGISFSENNNVNWIINDNKIDRDISFEELSKYSGCKPVENK